MNKRMRYRTISVLVVVVLYSITSYFAYSDIIEDAQESIDKSFVDYRVVTDLDEIDKKLKWSQERVYFVGDNLTLAPFFIKIKSIENHQALYLEMDHYYFWFFGYSGHVFSYERMNMTKHLTSHLNQ